MHIVKKDSSGVTITADNREIARLSKILEWVVTEHATMDKNNIALEEEEIFPAVKLWLDHIYKAIK